MELTKDILNRLHSPCFILDIQLLRNEVRELQSAISNFWSNTIVGYSVKTNSLPALARIFRSLGVFSETVSSDEYALMRRCGYNTNEIICNGPIKSFDYIGRIIEGNSVLNIDSIAEINHLIRHKSIYPNKIIKTGLRVNLDVSGFGVNNSRFGFSYENGTLGAVVRKLKNKGIIINGLHFHVGVLPGTLEKYRWLTTKFCEIVDALSLSDIEYLDLGGGFYGGLADKPKWSDYFNTISSVLLTNNYSSNNLCLIIEPGASLLAPVVSYISKVVDIKQISDERIIVCDGSRVHIDPLMHKSKYVYRIVKDVTLKKKSTSSIAPSYLVGYTCMENDRIMMIPSSDYLDINDFIIFDKVGSYTSTLSPQFISFTPPFYAFDSSGNILTLREKWSVDDFVQECIL